MTPQTAQADPFDVDFDAEAEYATPETGGHGETPDPFAGLSTPHLVDDEHPETEAGAAPNPIADMLASAEAALGEHTVPRITIHVFWIRPEMAELVEKASADRRMERAKTVVNEGGLAAAVSYYQNEPTPSLLIVEIRRRS